MSSIRTSLAVPVQPWETAKQRFLAGLSHEEAQEFRDATLENLFYNASAAQKRHAHGSRSWLVQERLSSLVDSIDDYGKALDVYSNTSGLILGPIWGSLRVILHIAREAGKFQDSIIDMLGQIGDAIPRFRIYETLFKNHDRLALVLSTAYLDIVLFCVTIKDFFSQARKSRIPLAIVLKGSWKNLRRDFDQHMANFRQHSKRIEREARVAHMLESAQVREIQIRNQALQLANDRARRRHQAIASIRTVDYAGKHSNLMATLHSGTNKWITTTKQYSSWVSSSSSTCLCCFGIPGSGKTLLAASLTDGLLKGCSLTELTCYYYCDFADSLSLDPSQIVACLVKQALVWLSTNEFGEDFKTPYEEGKPAPTYKQALDYLADLLRRFSTAHVIIDGLDELAPSNQTIVLDLVNFLCRSRGTIKLFITSRTEEYRVKSAMQNHATLFLSADRNDDDFALYIRDRIGHLAPSHPLIQNQSLKHDVVGALVAGAHGMFLWVKFQLFDIEEAITEATIREVVQNLPIGIEETYDRIIDKIRNGTSGEAKLSIVNQVLCWLAGARRPLHIDELEEAVGLSPDDDFLHTERTARNNGQELISSCGNLVVCTTEDEVVFAHHTVRQYLYSSRNHSRAISAAKLRTADAYIGDVCLTYLCFSDFDTQLTEFSKLKVDPTFAQNAVWTSVPLASRVRDVLTWTRALRGVQAEATLSLEVALPVTAQRADLLSKKFILLDYIIENWAFHTANLRPDCSNWTKFKHVALTRRLAFQHRPWDEQSHRKTFDTVMRELQRTSERFYNRHVSTPNRDPFEYIPLYSWAFKNAIGSLLALASKAGLSPYLDCVKERQELDGVEIKWIWHTQVHQLLLEFPIAETSSALHVSGSASASDPWSADIFSELLRRAIADGEDEVACWLDFFSVEYLSWAGTEEQWSELLCATVISATVRRDITMLKCLSLYIDSPEEFMRMLAVAFERGIMNRAILEITLNSFELCSSTPNLEWELIFLLEKYLVSTYGKYTGMPFNLNSEVYGIKAQRAILATAIAHKHNFNILNPSTPRYTEKQEAEACTYPTGVWHHTRSDIGQSWLRIHPLLHVNLFKLMRELQQIARDWLALPGTALVERIKIIDRLVVTCDTCPCAVDLLLFEEVECRFLKWAIRNDPNNIQRLFPLYDDLIAGDGLMQRQATEEIIREAHATMDLRATDCLSLLPWSDYAIEVVLNGSADPSSELFVEAPKRKSWLKSMGMMRP
ncbi:hypothetical protein NX059_011294 [Plenodomus lindquistii]|nr:hypothetical protein NX059_011294 [Plenodomus lindquistii]